jgi:hypothetical protein
MENDNEKCKCNSERKKKGIFSLLAMIWESMTKTGGCCGPGKSCGSTSNKSKMENKEKQKSEQ